MKVCKAARGMGRLPCPKPENCALAECELTPEEEAELSRPDGVILVDTGQKVIEDREEAHGDYSKQATTAQILKETLRNANSSLPRTHQESAEMICVKLSRIANGNPNDPDHWRDIAGYATLIANLLTRGTHL